MPELIDKKRTEAKVFLIARHFIDRPDREIELVKAVIHRCCEEIDKQPTIEAEPVRHGRWIKNKSGSQLYPYECTACNESCDYPFPYCPICGAKMNATDTNVLTSDGGADNG